MKKEKNEPFRSSNEYFKAMRESALRDREGYENTMNDIYSNSKAYIDGYGGNILKSIVDQSRVGRDTDAEKRWKQVAIFNNLSNAISLIGKGISAKNGVIPTRFDMTPTYMAINKLQKINDDFLRDERRYYAGLATDAIRRENRAAKMDDTKLKMDEKIYFDSNKSMREAQKEVFRNERENKIIDSRKELEQLRYENREKLQNSRAAVSKTTKAKSSYKPVGYVKDRNGKTKAIYPDDWTELYRLAYSNNLIPRNSNAKHVTERKNNIDVGIQRAFRYREKYFDNLKSQKKK